MREVYLHGDFDAFAPAAPSVAAEPAPGGLSPEDAENVLRTTAERFEVKAATLATYAPAHDIDHKTEQLVLSPHREDRASDPVTKPILRLRVD